MKILSASRYPLLCSPDLLLELLEQTYIIHSINRLVESDRLRVVVSRRISFSGFLLEEMQNQDEAKELVLLIFAIQLYGLPVTGTRYLRLLILYKLPYLCETLRSPRQVLWIWWSLDIPSLFFNLLKTNRNLFYTRNQSVPRSKLLPPRL